MSNVFETTISRGLCINCGLCVMVCNRDAVNISHNADNAISINYSSNKCTDCGKCVAFCTNSILQLKIENEKIVKSNYLTYGLEGAKCFVGNITDRSQLLRSSSGGITTYIAVKMLSEKMVDCIIHARNIESHTGEMHYKSCLSTSIEELDNSRSTVYCAISFEEALSELRRYEYKRVLLIGTPCIIRSCKKYLLEIAHCTLIYTVALACSHNVTNKFTDYLADTLKIPKSQSYKVNLRDKKDISNAHSFNNLFYNTKGFYKSINRFRSQFTLQWRNYSFSVPCCNACSDFWGYYADITIKDAWGKWQNNGTGKNVMILRNKNLEKIFANDIRLELEEISVNDVAHSQEATVKYKQGSAYKKQFCECIHDFDKIDIEHALNARNRDYSDKIYSYRDKQKVKRVMVHAKVTVILKRIFNNRITRSFQ